MKLWKIIALSEYDYVCIFQKMLIKAYTLLGPANPIALMILRNFLPRLFEVSECKARVWAPDIFQQRRQFYIKFSATVVPKSKKSGDAYH